MSTLSGLLGVGIKSIQHGSVSLSPHQNVNYDPYTDISINSIDPSKSMVISSCQNGHVYNEESTSSSYSTSIRINIKDSTTLHAATTASDVTESDAYSAKLNYTVVEFN